MARGTPKAGLGIRAGQFLSRAPMAGQDQCVAAAWTTQGGDGLGSVGLGNWRRAGCWALGGRLPGGLLSDGKPWRDFEQGAHTLELGAPARM